MNRRDFIFGGIGTIIGTNELYKFVNNKLKQNIENSIYNELSNQIYEAKHSAIAKVGLNRQEREITGMGVIINGKYLTTAHIPLKMQETIITIGEVNLPIKSELFNEKTHLNGNLLDRIFINEKEDVAIYDAKNIKDFEARPNTKRNLGDEVYLIGNPYLSGANIRKGRISDLNGMDKLDLTFNCFGADIPIIPGDSGCPLVNNKKELIGIAKLNINNSIGYFIKIEEFLKHL